MQEQTENSSVLREVKEKESFQHDKSKAVIEKNKVIIFYLLLRPTQIKINFQFQGNDYFKAGKYEEAAKCYTAAIELDSKDAVLPANRAIAYIKLNKYLK
jgi:tetratricopeptide (TPR) repeat protein